MKMVTAQEYVKKHSSIISNIRVVDERLLIEARKRSLLKRAQKIVIERLHSGTGFDEFDEGSVDGVYYMLVELVSKNKKEFGYEYEYGEDFAIIFHDEHFPKKEFSDWLQSYGWKLIAEDSEEWECIDIKTILYEENTGLRLPFDDEEEEPNN